MKINSGRLESALAKAKADLSRRWGYEWQEEDQEHFDSYMKPYIQSSTWRNTEDVATYIYAMFEVEIPGMDAFRWRQAMTRGGAY
eukprot:SAG11_NODE_4291_length_1967_cov_1.268201_3_plen_85_part_00